MIGVMISPKIYGVDLFHMKNVLLKKTCWSTILGYSLCTGCYVEETDDDGK